MPNYQDGKIYKIVNDIDNEIYVGSTCQLLCKRIQEHFKKSKDINTIKSNKLYMKINQIGKLHFKIILIEKCPCNDKEELLKREDYWRITLQAQLNSIACLLTHDQKKEKWRILRKKYCSKNQELLTERRKQNYEQNKEKIKNMLKETYVCDICGCKLTKNKKSRHNKSNYHMKFIKLNNELINTQLEYTKLF